MAEFGQAATVEALATALLHFLWQGSVIALAAATLMRVSRSAAVRYTIGIGALVAMLAAPAMTFAVLLDANSRTASSAGTGPAPLPAVQEAAVMTTQETAVGSTAIDGLWPAAGVFTWMAGMVILSLRLAGGWFVARRMTTRAVRPAAAHVQAAAAVLAEKLALRRAVRILESSAVAMPVLVGWLKPAVVFPVAALAGLSPAQIEALLAHELAHVHRHDYLVNLLQSFAEVILFYHPAVWWLSRRVRTERELCCDDLAVGLCDRLVYATALTDLAAMRAPRVAMAATGGDLLTRVKRILGREEPSMSSNARWIPAVAVAAITLAAVPALLATVRTTATSGEESPAVISAVAPVKDDASGANATAEPEPAADQSGPQEAEMRLAELRARLEELRAQMLARSSDLNGEARMLAEMQAIGGQKQKAGGSEEAVRQAAIESAHQDLQAKRRLFEVGLVTGAHVAEAEKVLALIEAGNDEGRRQEIEVTALKRQLEDAKQRFDVGLISKDDLARLEAELAILQASGDVQKQAELAMLEHEQRFARARELYQRGLMSTAQVRDAERQFQEIEQKYMEQLAKEQKSEPKQKEFELKKKEFEQKNKEFEQKVKEMLVEIEKVQKIQEKEIEKQVKEVSKTYEKNLREASLREFKSAASFEAVAARPIEAGDFLFISIEGESQLPTIYRIDSNGSLRVPLLGTFKALGQTPGQVREAIGKRLLDAKLGSPATVHVEIRRER